MIVIDTQPKGDIVTSVCEPHCDPNDMVPSSGGTWCCPHCHTFTSDDIVEAWRHDVEELQKAYDAS